MIRESEVFENQKPVAGPVPKKIRYWVTSSIVEKGVVEWESKEHYLLIPDGDPKDIIPFVAQRDQTYDTWKDAQIVLVQCSQERMTRESTALAEATTALIMGEKK